MALETRPAFLAFLRPLTLVLALVACGRPSAGQPPPRAPQAPAISPAARALLEGRYDEVDKLMSSAAATDPGAAALAAKADIARGRYDDALALLQPVASRAPGSDAALELGLLEQMLGRPEADGVLRRVAAPWQSTNDPVELARAARALEALNEFQQANSSFRDASAARPADPGHQHGVGRSLSGRRQPLGSDEVVSGGAQGGRAVDAGAHRHGAGPERRRSAARARRHQAGARGEPAAVDAHVFLAARAVDADHDEEAHEAIRQALAVNPNSLDAHSLLAAMAYVHDDHARFDAETQKVLAIAPHVRRGVSHRRASRRRGPLPVRGGGRAGAPRARAADPRNPHALSDLGLHLLRTGDERGAREALEQSFKLYPYDVVAFNLLGMMDTLDTFVTVDGRQHHSADEHGRGAAAPDYVLALAHKALDRLSDLYQFTPQGADPDRDVLEARRLRRAQSRAARDDRRPGRLFRPRRHARLAARAAARARSSGSRRSGTSSRTSSRFSCRTSAFRAG